MFRSLKGEKLQGNREKQPVFRGSLQVKRKLSEQVFQTFRTGPQSSNMSIDTVLWAL